MDKGSYEETFLRLEQLGTGAFANVYKCQRRSNPAQVFALKVANDSSARIKETFDTEAQIHKKLKHENIVNLHQCFSKPKLALVYDLCKGGDLFDDVEKRQFYSETDAAHCIRQIFSGVSYVNSQGIIHRDLKPENILLTADNVVKIGDFGWAVDVSACGGKTRGIAGTTDYIAPEVYNKKVYDRKADSWSCGIILYWYGCESVILGILAPLISFFILIKNIIFKSFTTIIVHFTLRLSAFQ